MPGFAQKFGCLPSDVKEDTVVSTETTRAPKGGKEINKVTVGQTLKKLNARCKNGKLLDGQRHAIRFYHLDGCWGNPPQDYLEIMANQQKEIAALKKKYTVIELTCNPSGLQLPLMSNGLN